MAAAALPAVQAGEGVAEIAERVAAETKARIDEFAQHPVLNVANWLVKWGSVSAVVGVALYAVAYAAKNAAQSYLNDLDGVYGVSPETPPTAGTPAAPAQSPAPPPTPPQVIAMNAIVADLNSLGTTSASTNVAALQDALKQLWAIAGLEYGIGGTAQTPPVATGTQTAIAIVQVATLIYYLEGRPIDGTSFQWQTWVADQGQVYTNGSADVFLSGITAIAEAPFASVGTADWTACQTLLSNEVNNDNLKITLNTLAQQLNMSQPWDLTVSPPANQWGILGTVAMDLSGIGAEIAQEATSIGQSIENGLETVAKDLQSIDVAVGTGLLEFGKTMLNLPRVLFDSLGYAGSWGAEQFAGALAPFFLGIGIGMVAVGLTLRYYLVNIHRRLVARFELYSNARLARWFNKLDKRFGTRRKVQEVWTQKSTEGMIASANANPLYVPPVVAELPPPTPLTETPSPPQLQAGPAAEVGSTQAELAGGAPLPGVPNEPAPATPEPPGPTAIAPPEPPAVNTPAEISHENPTPLSETPVPPEGTTEAAEALLGEGTAAPSPEELRAQAEQLRIAQRDLAAVSPPTRRQLKEERERAEADRLIEMGENWSSVPRRAQAA